MYYFHARTAEEILAADRAGNSLVEVSLDLNISVKSWEIRDHCLVLGDDLLPVAGLEPVAGDKNKVFGWDGNAIAPIEVRADGYYKLVPTDTVPTLEINGVKMHRSKDIDPLEDARLKTELVVRPGDRVLDTCGGLGYSALFALRAGARTLVSSEKSPAVIRIREQNPWLQPGAFDWFTPEAAGRITLNHGDITRIITGLPDQEFNAVIHDPPRFTSATGDLYGRVFYGQLARVMKNGGRLFHYTGSPKKIVHQDRFIQNAMKRLDAAGFGNISFNERLQGIYAEKNKRILP
ncbi:MAG: hypothetical protein HUN04_16205 [Desulfobacter sp.]|nr:MAG: hypothetical protein HUN04_16205 [Desulfobacter sp.]